jgi:parallel beta-helix repeat protein
MTAPDLPAKGLPAQGLQPGERVEHVVIERVLGRGGHGPLYLARDIDFGIVAVKEFAPGVDAPGVDAPGVDAPGVDGESLDAGKPDEEETTPDPEDAAAEETGYDARFAAGLTLFRLMGQALCEIRHPNLAAVRRCIEARGTAYLVMDHVEGADLDHVLAEDEVPRSDAALEELLLAILGALDRLHGACLIHRDVKPANIRLGPEGVPVLVDFGAALPTDLAAEPPYQSRLTPGYAAPEQYRADAREGPWTDVYGLAAVAYRVISGAPPPDAPARARGSPLVAAVDVGRGRHAGPVLASIDRALSLEAEERPQSAREWIAALRPPLETDQAEQAATIHAPVPAVADAAAGADQPDAVDAPGAQIEIPDKPIEIDAVPAGRRRPLRPWLWMAAAVLVLMALPAAIIGGRTYYLAHIKNDWIVDAEGNGDVKSITEAMATARSGATVRIRPGRYAEALVMARPLILKGEGDAATIVVVAPGAGPCITITAAAGAISGLSFIAGSGGEAGRPPPPRGACVDIAGAGSVTISDTIISNAAGAGVRIGGAAAPEIRANRIEHTLGPAVIIEDRAAGTIADTTIVASGAVGILIRDTASPLVTGNRINASAQAGILASGDSKARISENQITDSARSGIEVRGRAAPTVEGNSIESAGQAGIYVYEGGHGTYRGNSVVGSAFSGVIVGPGAHPMMTGNRIAANSEHGILVLAHGGGGYRGNTIADNAGHGIAIDIGARLEPDDIEGADNVLSGNRKPQLVIGETPTLEAEPRSQIDSPSSNIQ